MILSTPHKYDLGSIYEIIVTPYIVMRYQIVNVIEEAGSRYGTNRYVIVPAEDNFIVETLDIGDCE